MVDRYLSLALKLLRVQKRRVKYGKEKQNRRDLP